MSRRGRKRQSGVPREKSGRIDRKWAADRAERANMETVLDMRQRVFGLTLDQARSEKSASLLGRLYITGALGKEEAAEAKYRAGVKFIEVRESYHKAILARSDVRQKGSGGSLELMSDEYEEWAQRAVARYENVMEAVQRESCVLRNANLFAAIDYMLVRDEYHPHMEGDLNIALNVMVRHWGLDEVSKRAPIRSWAAE